MFTLQASARKSALLEQSSMMTFTSLRVRGRSGKKRANRRSTTPSPNIPATDTPRAGEELTSEEIGGIESALQEITEEELAEESTLQEITEEESTGEATLQEITEEESTGKATLQEITEEESTGEATLETPEEDVELEVEREDSTDRVIPEGDSTEREILERAIPENNSRESAIPEENSTERAIPEEESKDGHTSEEESTERALREEESTERAIPVPEEESTEAIPEEESKEGEISEEKPMVLVASRSCFSSGAVDDEVFHDTTKVSPDEDASGQCDEENRQVEVEENVPADTVDKGDEARGTMSTTQEDVGGTSSLFSPSKEVEADLMGGSTTQEDVGGSSPFTSPSKEREAELMRGYALIADLANFLMLPPARSEPPKKQREPTMQEEEQRQKEEDERLEQEQEQEHDDQPSKLEPEQDDQQSKHQLKTVECGLRTIDEDAELQDTDEMWDEVVFVQRQPPTPPRTSSRRRLAEHPRRSDADDATSATVATFDGDDSTVPLSESFSEDSSSDQDDAADDSDADPDASVPESSCIRDGRRRSILKEQSSYESCDSTPNREADVDACSEVQPVEIKDDLTMIAFDTINIREYSMALGDHPGVTTGPPVTLGWDYEEMDPIDLDHYEVMKGEARTVREMRMTYYRRRDLLLETGEYTHEDLDAASALVTRIKKQRKQSENLIAVAPIEEAMQTMKRAMRWRSREKVSNTSESTSEAIVPRPRPKRRTSARRMMSSAARAIVPSSQTNLAFWGRRDRRPWQMTLAGEMIARQRRSFVAASAVVRRKSSTRGEGADDADSAASRRKSKKKSEKKARSKVEGNEKSTTVRAFGRKAKQ